MSITNLSRRLVLVLVLSIGFGVDAFAQFPFNQPAPGRSVETDLIGEWEDVSWEESDRGMGFRLTQGGAPEVPEPPPGGGGGAAGNNPIGAISDGAIGNYTGIPYNDAGRLKGTTWDAGLYSAIPNYALKPHPAQYSMRGFIRQFRIQKVIHPDTQDLVAFTLTGGYDAHDRLIWMDGRSHPPDYAEHTWRGFSTGRWERGMLVVTTTHMKFGNLRRNGAPASDVAKMTEYFIRHDDRLIHVQFIDDPAFLEEPFIRTTDFRLGRNLHARTGHIEWDNGDEVVREKGYIPSYPLGTRHTEFADLLGIPFEATQGGKDTLYPEYRFKLQELMRGSADTSSGTGKPQTGN